MNLQFNFMDENSTPHIIENDDLNLKTDDNDYMQLINRLKEISKTILLLEKKILK